MLSFIGFLLYGGKYSAIKKLNQNGKKKISFMRKEKVRICGTRQRRGYLRYLYLHAHTYKYVCVCV